MENNAPLQGGSMNYAPVPQGQARILMTHHSSPASLQSNAEPTNSTENTLQRRTAERVMQFRNNWNSVIREFQPLMESARSVNTSGLSSFLNRSSSVPADHNQPSTSSNTNGSVVINLENINVEPQANSQNLTNNPNETSNNESSDEEPAANTTVDEVTIHVRTIVQYLPFVIILLIKAMYDHHEGILNFIVLMTAFTHANSVVKSEATKRSRRNLSRLFLALLYLSICMLCVYYLFESERLYLNLIFINSFEKLLTLWDLMWIVGMTDFMLKLITVMVKICLTLLPGKIIAFEKRGKLYLFIEATSQFYRSLTPIKPWIYYLLESYHGTETFVGVFLSTAYMISKSTDLAAKMKLFKTSVFKLMQNVAVGSSPSKDQINAAGGLCPICHDEYSSPVLLQCNHIFCEGCVTTWFDREQTCPLCRAKIVDVPAWRDGSTTFFLQLF